MSLTDTILEQIDAYDMERFDAEANVIRAHMEASLRDIKISEECERIGIIMEGDVVPKRDGENIFKYILLFLPRLVINILRKISRWITGNPEIRTTEELKELAKKKEEEFIKNHKESIIRNCREGVVRGVNYKLHQQHPSAICVAYVTDDGEYGCKWNIESIEGVAKVYQDYIEYFTKYIEVFERLNQKKDLIIDDEHNQDIIDFDKELNNLMNSNGAMEKLVRKEPTVLIDMETARQATKSCKTGGFAKCWKNVEDQMDKLIELYHEMDQSSKISQSNLRFATRYYNSIERVFSTFTKFHTYFGEAVAGANFVYNQIPAQIKIVFDGKKKEYNGDVKDTYENILKQGGFYDGD